MSTDAPIHPQPLLVAALLCIGVAFVLGRFVGLIVVALPLFLVAVVLAVLAAVRGRRLAGIALAVMALSMGFYVFALSAGG
ncbi:MAG: hypothetical protein HKN04_14390 [Rhodothermaceae bacterium]|nr:hypothetical protein [Rhodothermaceae bacterium]